jgi:hypothetical protein
MIVGVVVSLAVFGALGLFAFVWNSMSIKETPTCAFYFFNLEPARLAGFQHDTRKVLAELEIPIRADTSNGASWEGKNTSVTIYARAHKESTAFVCETTRQSRDWQAVATRLELVMSQNGVISRSYLQLNPALFSCGFVCAKDVEAPIDFRAFNSGTMILPPTK